VVEAANAVLGCHRPGDRDRVDGNGQHIIFNGEIHNYREARRALTGEGVQFHRVRHRCPQADALGTAVWALRGMFGFDSLMS
jgi:asparagine synthetase B (glutamine-hydrolysing)